MLTYIIALTYDFVFWIAIYFVPYSQNTTMQNYRSGKNLQNILVLLILLLILGVALALIFKEVMRP